MGAGASLNNAEINKISNEQLIAGFMDMYKNDPAKYDLIISEGKKKYFDEKLAHEASAISNSNSTNATSAVGSPSNKKQIISIPKEFDDMDYFSEQLTVALNHARTNPTTFATNFLEKHLNKFVDEFIYEEDVVILASSALNPNSKPGPDGNTVIEKRKVQSKEGKAAVHEAIQFMKKLPSPSPFPLITSSKALVKASLDHCQDIGPNGSVEHAGSNGSTTGDRVSKYCVWSECLGENIDFGNCNVYDIVCALIIDDGVANRGHRKNIFNPGFKVVGGAISHHSVYDVCCVMDFAGQIKQFDEVVRYDTEVTCCETMSEEFRKTLCSIPSNDNSKGLLKQMNEELAKGATILLCFQPSLKKASIKTRIGNSVSTMNMSWAPA